MKYRIEKDTMGGKGSENVYWGPQTERSRQNFKIRHQSQCQLKLFVVVLEKIGCNGKSQAWRFEKNKKDLIVKVCDEIIEGKLDDLPLVI